MKTCIKCGKQKSLTDFRTDTQGRKGKIKTYYRPECKSCEKKLRDQYNIAKKQATTQPQACECCNKVTTKLVVDHDHQTGKFRGWLCRSCNQGIGKLGDTISDVQAALNYLNNSKPTIIKRLHNWLHTWVW